MTGCVSMKYSLLHYELLAVILWIVTLGIRASKNSGTAHMQQRSALLTHNIVCGSYDRKMRVQRCLIHIGAVVINH